MQIDKIGVESISSRWAGPPWLSLGSAALGLFGFVSLCFTAVFSCPMNLELVHPPARALLIFLLPWAAQAL